MSLFRRLGRSVERFRQLTKAAAEEAESGRSGVRCTACDAWIPPRYDGCPQCGHRSPHAVLGVSPGASDEAVREAARERIKSAHPDGGGSTEEFQRVKEARDTLLES